MRLNRSVALGASMLVLLASACSAGGGGSSSESPSGSAQKPAIVVGSAAFTESAVVAEIYAQALESKGYSVDRKLNIGARDAYLAALSSDQINLVPEYIGSLVRNYGGEATGDTQQTIDNLKVVLAQQDPPLAVLAAAPGTDADGWAVQKETADQYNLKTMTDLAAVAGQLRWGFPAECATNPSCGPGLKSVYGIDISTLDAQDLPACSPESALKLNAGEIQVLEVCTTQADIERFNFVVLEDDKHLAPAQNVVPLTTQALLDSAPDDFAGTLNAVSARLTTAELIKLGAAVDVHHEDVAAAARQWLTDQGLT
jgi:osmoprotectant transport system substrate-binding protein